MRWIIAALALLPAAAWAQQSSGPNVRNGSTAALITQGTSLYPTGPGSLGNYNANSSVIENTIGAKNGLFGLAAKDTLHWINSYQPGIDSSGVNTLYVISPTGQYSVTSAVRSGDNTAGTAQNIIDDNGSCVSDNLTVAHRVWCRYEHGIITSTAVVGGHINDENSVLNLGSAITSDPYNLNPAGQSSNVRLDSGIGDGRGNAVSAAATILSNGAKYFAGLQFGADAFDTSQTGGVGHAIQMPALAALTWQHATGLSAVDWRFYSAAIAANGPYNIEGGGAVQIGPSGGNLVTLQGGTTPNISTTAGDLNLSSASGNINAGILNSPGFAPRGYVNSLALASSPIGIYGGSGAPGSASGTYAFPTCSVAAPSGGTAATCSLPTWSVLSIPTIASGGTGYSVNDVLTLVGGTFTTAATLRVTTVSSGAITAVTRINDASLNDGSYSAAPPAPVTVTGGTGTGATFTNLGWRPTAITLLTGGSGYTSSPAVVITGQTSPNAGSQGSVVTTAVSNTFSGTAANGSIVLDNGGTELGTSSQPTNVLGLLKIAGHISGVGGSAPTASVGTITTGSSDTRGSVALAASATSSVITFATAFSPAPFCVVSGSVTTATPGAAATTTTLTIGLSANAAGNTVTWHCMQ